MRSQNTASRNWIKNLKTQLTDARIALEKLTNGTSRTEASSRAETIAVEEWIDAEKARVKSLKRKIATKVEKKQQLLTEHRERSQTATRPVAEREKFFSGLQYKLAAMTAERNEWFDLARKTTKMLKAVEADVVLHSTLLGTAWEEMDTHITRIVKLQEQPTAMGAELSQLSAKHSELADDLRRVKMKKFGWSYFFGRSEVGCREL